MECNSVDFQGFQGELFTMLGHTGIMAHAHGAPRRRFFDVANRHGPALPVGAGQRVYVLVLNEKTERYEVQVGTMWSPWLLPMDVAQVRIAGAKVRVSAARVYMTRREAADDKNVWNKWIDELPPPITKGAPKRGVRYAKKL